MRIGLYDVVGRVAEGRTSVVWKARDQALERDVALKQVVLDGSAESGSVRREATLLSSLEHPNIVRVYDLIEQDGQWWLVQEWVPGATLAEVVAKVGRLTPPQSLSVVRGALLGLAFAHSRKVVHGDVAPSNIMVNHEGESKLIDFGLSRGVGEAATGGTPAYASPEALAGASLSPAADVYSVASILIEVLGGDLRSIHPEVRPVLTKATAAEPSTRHPDAQAFLDDFDRAAERAFGPGWWGAAGLGAAAASATPAVLGGLGVGAVAASEGASLGSVATAGAAPVSAVRIGAGRLKTGLVVAGSVVALGAVVAGAVAVTRDGNPTAGPVATQTTVSQPTDAGQPLPTASATPTPAQPATSFTGTYTYLEVVTASNNSDTKVGQKVKDTWTVRTTCTNTCTAAVKNSDGDSYSLPMAQSGWKDSYTTKDYCVFTDSGKTDKSRKVRQRYRREVKVSEKIDGQASKLTGKATFRQLDPCRDQADPLRKVDYKITVTLKR